MWWKLILGVAGLIGLAVIIAVIKMAITEAKEEADDIERASGNKLQIYRGKRPPLPFLLRDTFSVPLKSGPVKY